MSSPIPCSPVTASIVNHSLKSELRPENSSTDSVQPAIMEDLRSQVFKGQLYKFTNVVKGMFSSTRTTRPHIQRQVPNYIYPLK